MRGELFYNSSNKKVFVNTHVTFLKEDYVNNFKLKSKVILEELVSAQEPFKSSEFGPSVPLLLVHVQREKNKNVLEGEQVQLKQVVEK